jgi:hypothetical protein
VRSEQFELCCEVPRRLDCEGVLKHVVLIGSWCLLAYEDFFTDSGKLKDKTDKGGGGVFYELLE